MAFKTVTVLLYVEEKHTQELLERFAKFLRECPFNIHGPPVVTADPLPSDKWLLEAQRYSIVH